MSVKHKQNLDKLEALNLDRPFFNFHGCTETIYPGIQYAFHKICEQSGINLVESDDQTCCSGDFLLFNLTTSTGVAAIAQRNLNVVHGYSKWLVTLCNGCFSSFMMVYRFLQRDPDLKDRVKNALQTHRNGSII